MACRGTACRAPTRRRCVRGATSLCGLPITWSTGRSPARARGPERSTHACADRQRQHMGDQYHQKKEGLEAKIKIDEGEGAEPARPFPARPGQRPRAPMQAA